jgi:hypothetical protein
VLQGPHVGDPALPPPHHMPRPARPPCPSYTRCPSTGPPLPFSLRHRSPLASVVVPRTPFLSLCTPSPQTNALVPLFLPSASRPRRWPNHPHPSPDSVEIVFTTAAFHGSPPPQRPTVPPPLLSHRAGPRRPPKVAGAAQAHRRRPGGSALPAKRRHPTVNSSTQ